MNEIVCLCEFLQALDLGRVDGAPFIVVLGDAVELHDELLDVLEMGRIQVEEPGILSSLNVHLEEDTAVLFQEGGQIGGTIGLLVMNVLLDELDVSGVMIRIVMDGTIKRIGGLSCHSVGLDKISGETLFVAHARGEVEVVSTWKIGNDIASVSLGAVADFFIHVEDGEEVGAIHSFGGGENGREHGDAGRVGGGT